MCSGRIVGLGELIPRGMWELWLVWGRFRICFVCVAEFVIMILLLILKTCM